MTRSKTSLVAAVQDCNHSLVEDYLASGASANEQDNSTGESLLAIASQHAESRLVTLLLEAGANPNGSSTAWPLDVAAGRGNLEVVELLLDAGAEVNSIDEDGGTALTSAACAGHHQIVSILIEAGANPKWKDHSGNPAIIYAAERGHEEIVSELMPLSAPKFRKQADLVLRVETQGPPSAQVLMFFAAVEVGNANEIQSYLEEGGDIEVIDSEGRTALCKAAASGQVEAVKLLLGHRANPKHVDVLGNCPVELSVHCYEVFEILFPITPKALKKSVEAIAPMLAIRNKRQAEIERQLTEQGPPDKSTIDFLNAAEKGRLDVVEAFLRNGGNIDAMDDIGSTALIRSAFSGKLDVVKHLVAAGANINHLNTQLSFALLAAGGSNKCFVYFYLQPLTEGVLREYSDNFLKSRRLWWI